MSDTVGIRELRQKASEIISAAENGHTFEVTVRGKATGVLITKHPTTAQAPRRRGVTLAQIKHSGLYTRSASADYQDAMLDMVERGRSQSGRVGDPDQ